MSHSARAALVPLSALLLSVAPAAALRARAHNGKHEANGTSAVGGKVVTMGDSYSSGTGIHRHIRDYEGGDCCRDWKTIPGARFAGVLGMEGVNVACAGGELPEIHRQFDDLQAQYKEDAASGWNGSVMIFTIGGNDLKTAKGDSWPALLTSCIASFYGKCHQKAENQMANFDKLQADLKQFYTKVARGARRASIRVMGYPRMLQRGWQCIPVPGLAGSAANWADAQVDELNSRIGQAVAEVRRTEGVDIAFVDVRNFITKGACSTIKKHVWSIKLSGLGLSPMSFHPTQRGYNKYYDALGQSMKRGLPPAPEPNDPIEMAEVTRILDGWDSDKSGMLCIGEVLSMGGDDASPAVSKRLRALFHESDKDQDDLLSVEEFAGFLALVGQEDEAL